MKPIFVLANADSRLHADVMMIRLRRAGIAVDKISAFFSRRFAPNSIFIWLRSPGRVLSRCRGSSFVAAGPLRRLFRSHERIEAMPKKLEQLGFDHLTAEHFARYLLLGHPILCVRASNEEEASIAWHIFKHARSEAIALAGMPEAVAAANAAQEEAIPFSLIPPYAA